VVVLAQEEARLLDHSYIGTEHILLGLLRESEGIAAQTLAALNVDLAEVRSQVVEIIGRGSSSPPSHIPFTPRAKKVLELSLRESLMLGHNYIGSEHILLGLIREGEGVACQILQNLGVDLPNARSKVAELVGVDPASVERPLPGRGRSFRCKHPDDALQIGTGKGLRTVRCAKCGELVGILPPEASSEAG